MAEGKNQCNSFTYVKKTVQDNENQTGGSNTWLNEEPKQTHVNIIN